MAAFDVQTVIGCTDPSGLAEFWAEALAYVVEPPPAGFDSWAEFAERIGIPPKDRDRLAAVVDPERVRPRVLFQKAPETKKVKNRVHLDIDVAPGMPRAAKNANEPPGPAANSWRSAVRPCCVSWTSPPDGASSWLILRGTNSACTSRSVRSLPLTCCQGGSGPNLADYRA